MTNRELDTAWRKTLNLKALIMLAQVDTAWRRPEAEYRRQTSCWLKLIQYEKSPKNKYFFTCCIKLNTTVEQGKNMNIDISKKKEVFHNA